ncbi:RtcB family protein [Anaerocolumna sp.]|uniref:RtcB family protein n=1 Tax=Anaerocolumna sp. TaxID=2041569 RepID=UPI0028AB3A01|nr:RtcB family protein [Anaerocolumna sp.]
MNQEDIVELIINSDIEADYQSLSLSGTMIRSNKYLYPVGSGFDIGCGLGVFKTNINLDQINIKDLFNVKSPFGIRRQKYKLYSKKIDTSTEIGKILCEEKLGDIETGNHFIEIRTCEGNIYIVIHSGISECMKMYFAQHIIKFFKEFNSENLDADNTYAIKIPKNNEKSKSYINEVQITNQFAEDNRKYIAYKIAEKLGGKVISSFDSSHEYIKIDCDDIIHCNGTQEFKDRDGIMLALILSGFERDNYIVEMIGEVDYINHGTVMLKNNINGERVYSSFEEIIEMEQLRNVKPIYKLSPICGCKKGKSGYEYCIL